MGAAVFKDERSDVRFAKARTRAAVSFAAGIAALAVALALTPWQMAALIGWSTTAGVTVGWTIAAVLHRDATGTKELATREDDSRAVSDLLVISAASASLVAVGLALVKAGHDKGSAKALLTALAVLAVALSWAVVHSVFTLRYAHVYYSGGGGVDFNEDADPDYRDFAYLALTIGMTFQVSDTDLTTKEIRRTATRHALLAYLFGAVIVAMAINVVASLLSK
jgi:uncharacterized membrane protein